MKRLETRVRELERALGRQTMQFDILKEAVKIAREKKTDLARAIARGGRFRLKPIAEALDISRSNLSISLKADRGSRPEACDKPRDADALEEIKKVSDKRPTYGYLRVTAVLKREKKAKKESTINHKRVYRIMKNAGMILPKSGVRTEKAH